MLRLLRPWMVRVILAIGVLACVAAPSRSAEPVRIRVLTYNIQHGAGMDRQIDLERTAAVIKRLAPDVVALQEVDNQTTRAGGVAQAAELGKLTGMHAAFGKAMDYAGGQYGNAILSRFPVGEVHVHELPFEAGSEPRCAVAARIRFGPTGPEIVFVSTHLEHAKAPVRLGQAQTLDAALTKDNAWTIVAGDLNDVPDSPTIKSLQAGWTDATAEQPDPTWPADHPRVKIDYVFFRPSAALRVVERQVIDEPAASDHRPLLVVLETMP